MSLLPGPQEGTGSSLFTQEHRAAWSRLSELLDRAEGSRRGRLSGSEVLELGRLYRRAAADLAYLAAHPVDESTSQDLNRLVSRAHAYVYVHETVGLRSVLDFLWTGFPALVYQRRVCILAATATALLGVLCALLWPDLGRTMVPSSYRTPRMDPALSPLAAVLITANNVQVALRAFAGGITLGAFTLYVLFMNGVMLGGVSSLIAAIGESSRFWPSIYPHGVIELTAIMIAGGAGLRVGWALVSPGDYTRQEALRQAGMDAIRLAIGTVPLFVVAGTIEGYVSFSSLPAVDKLGLGTLAAAALFLYLARGKEAVGSASRPPGGMAR